MKYLLLILLILKPYSAKKLQKLALKLHKTEIVIDTSYTHAINTMKKWETYAGTRYELFGDTYIGYGHLLYSKDTITYLSEQQADSLLKSDFAKAQRFVDKICPKLPKKRKLLLALFAFNCGVGTLQSSEILQMFIRHEPDYSIKEHYFKYVFAGKRYLPKLRLRRGEEFGVLE